MEASVKGDGEAIKTFSKSIHEAKAKIDGLFDELASLTGEMEIKSKEFEEKLKSF